MIFDTITADGTSTKGFIALRSCKVTMEAYYSGAGTATIAVHTKRDKVGTWHALSCGTASAPTTPTAVAFTATNQLSFNAVEGQRFRLVTSSSASSPSVSVTAGAELDGIREVATIADY